MRLATPPPIPRHTAPLRLSDFDLKVPKRLIAKYPREPRDQARLMVVDRYAKTIEHRRVEDLPEYFDKGDVLVPNDTKVFSARLRGTKDRTDAKVEVLLLRELNPETRLWDAIVSPARKIRCGNKLNFDERLEAEVIDNTTNRGRTIRFIFDGAPQDLYETIEDIGETPIPPYLRRKAEPEDRDRYQTCFARHRGAVAAPCSGLHFTRDLVEEIKGRGVSVAPATLHAGLGSFRPVEVEDISRHRMHSESYAVSDETASTVNAALLSEQATVTVCGASTARALETTLTCERYLKAGSGWTDKFIYPPYKFFVTERLLINFHRPRSTPLMLTAAFMGMDLLKRVFEEAVEKKYRLHVFGDAMLVV